MLVNLRIYKYSDYYFLLNPYALLDTVPTVNSTAAKASLSQWHITSTTTKIFLDRLTTTTSTVITVIHISQRMTQVVDVIVIIVY